MGKKIDTAIDTLLPPAKLLIFESKDEDGKSLEPDPKYVSRPYVLLCDCEPCRKNKEEFGLSNTILSSQHLVMN